MHHSRRAIERFVPRCGMFEVGVRVTFLPHPQPRVKGLEFFEPVFVLGITTSKAPVTKASCYY